MPRKEWFQARQQAKCTNQSNQVGAHVSSEGVRSVYEQQEIGKHNHQQTATAELTLPV